MSAAPINAGSDVAAWLSAEQRSGPAPGGTTTGLSAVGMAVRPARNNRQRDGKAAEAEGES
jgi:hypothetical protein